MKRPSSARAPGFKVGPVLAEWGLVKEPFMLDKEKHVKKKLATIKEHSRDSRRVLKELEKELRAQQRKVRQITRHERKLARVNAAINKKVTLRIRKAYRHEQRRGEAAFVQC